MCRCHLGNNPYVATTRTPAALPTRSGVPQGTGPKQHSARSPTPTGEYTETELHTTQHFSTNVEQQSSTPSVAAAIKQAPEENNPQEQNPAQRPRALGSPSTGGAIQREKIAQFVPLQAFTSIVTAKHHFDGPILLQGFGREQNASEVISHPLPFERPTQSSAAPRDSRAENPPAAASGKL